MPEPGIYEFNMHKLFPEKFPEGDELGRGNWDYDWMIENTGSKRLPAVEMHDEEDAEANTTRIYYDSARVPNNGTLERLHQITGWTITNEYEDECREFEGTFECAWGDIINDERPGRPWCNICEKRMTWNIAIYDDDDGYICPACSQSKKEGTKLLRPIIK